MVVFGEQVNRRALGSHAVVQRSCPEGSGKGNYSDIPRVPYLRCKRTMDRIT